jgi:hypothetical protein
MVITDEINIEIPSGWQIPSLPATQKQDGHVINYSLTMTNENGSLHVARTMTVDFLVLDRKYYGALRTFFQGVKTSDDQQILLQPGATTASK